MDTIEKGDYVLTTSGFYGVIIDITDEDVIVEFGNNKTVEFQCRRVLLHRLKSLHLHMNKRLAEAVSLFNI